MKKAISRTLFVLMFVLLLGSVFTGPFSVHLARANASSQGATAQTIDPDYWPMFHHDPSHTGYSTSTGPTTNNTIWTYTTGGGVYSSPAVVGGLVYVGSDDNRTYCLNATTGALVWSYKTGNGVGFSSPAVVGGSVFVGSYDGKVYCLNAATGKSVWNYTTDGMVDSSPAVVGGLVYLGSMSHYVYCLNATNGARVWSHEIGGGVWSSPAVVGGLVYVGCDSGKVYCLNATTGAFVWSCTTGSSVFSSPAVVGGFVFVGSIDGNVYCLNATTGEFRWSYLTGGGVVSSPAVAGNLVFVGSYNDTKVYCLNASNGAFVWSYTTGNHVGYSSPAIVGGFVFVGSCYPGYDVYCLNAATGSYVWSYKTGGEVDSSPAVVNGVVYVGSCDDKIYAFGPPSWPMFHHDLSHTGTLSTTGPTTNSTLWTYTTGGGVYSSPAVLGGFVYVGSADRNVYCLDATTGARVWNYTTGNEADSSPAVVGGFVYVGSIDNSTYCLNAATGAKVWSYKTGSYEDSSPVVVGGLVYVGSYDGHVYCLNATTGALVWSYTTGVSAGVVDSSPAVADGLVYVGGNPDVCCLNATSGKSVWNYTIGSNVASSPAVVSGRVYVGCGAWKVYCLNATTGAYVWNYTTGRGVASSPTVVGGLVFVGSNDHNVYCLNATTGARVWNYTTGNGAYSSPAVVGGLVFVGSNDHNVYCLSAATGTKVWSYTTAGDVFSSPAVVNGVVYVGSGDDKVYAFSTPYLDFGRYGALVSTIGKNVTASPSAYAQVTFANITKTGVLTMNVTQPTSNTTTLTTAPNSMLASIKTNATYVGNVSLKFTYNPTGLTLQDQKAMKIWLWNTTSTEWVDITTSVDTINHIVYGVSPHLSMFGITSSLSVLSQNSVEVKTDVQYLYSLPGSYSALPDDLRAMVYLNMSTSQPYYPSYTIRAAYNSSFISSQEAQFIRMWLWNTTSGRWVDITKTVDTVGSVIYGVSPHLSMFGITCLPQFPMGIVVAGEATCSKTIVGKGYTVSLTMPILNRGLFTQSFDVFIYANTTLIGTAQVSNIPPSGQTNITFTYTAGLAYGNYSISICDRPISWLKVTIPGDINGDGVVGTKDLHILGVNWGLTVPPADPNADIGSFGVVGAKDLHILGVNWGLHT